MRIDLDDVGKFLALGYTFGSHVGDDPRPPAFWLEPRSALVPDGETVAVPSGIDAVNFGPELTAVLDEPLWRADADEAAAAVAGFTVSNDVGIRTWPDGAAVNADAGVSRIPELDLELESPPRDYKLFPTFRPVSTDVAELAPEAVTDLAVEVSVDGERRPRHSTAEMRFGVGELIAAVSHRAPLEAGDLVALGEPDSPVVEADCRVSCRVESVGAVTNPVAWSG